MFSKDSENGVSCEFSRWYAAAVSLFLIVICGLVPSVQAGVGHDHSDDEIPDVASGITLPRFTATSEHFELVGVVNAKNLTLYLDEADSNVPVSDVALSLKVGTEEVDVEQHAPGEFEVQLSTVPGVGVVPVTVKVMTSQGNEVLLGELDIHEAETNKSAEGRPNQRAMMSWGVLGGVAFAGFATGLACSGLGRRFISGGQGNADIGGEV